MSETHSPYDVMLETSGKDKLARFLRALVQTQSYFTCSLAFGDTLEDPYASIEFRVWIKKGFETRFEDWSETVLTHPPRVRAGNSPCPVVPCDMCKGTGKFEPVALPGQLLKCPACKGNGEEPNELKRKLVLRARAKLPGCRCSLCNEIRQREELGTL